MAVSAKFQPFDGTSDFSIWKVRMKAILIKEKCYRAVTEEWLAGTSDERKKELQEQAHSEIMIRLSDDVIRQVVNFSNPKELWDALDAIFLTKSLPSRISLLCRLFNFRMNVSMSIQENLDVFLKMTQDLARCDENIKETHQAVVLLNALPAEFDNLKDVIQYGRDEISLAKIIEAVVQKNQSLKVFKLKNGAGNEPSSDSKNEVMFSKGKNKKKGQNNHSSDETSADKSKPVFKCSYCNKKGHTFDFCFKRKREEKDKAENSKNTQSGLLVESDVVYAHELLVASAESAFNSWILDSGCTMHATPHKNLFCKLELCDGGEVKLGNDTSLHVRGIGCVPLKMHDGVIRIIQNVCWLPDLRRNILSESVFDSLGCHVSTFNGVKEVSLNEIVVIKCFRRAGLYFVDAGSEFNNLSLDGNECNILAALTPSFETLGTLSSVTRIFSSGLGVDYQFCGAI